MQSFWEIVASNALLVVVLAAGVALLGRLWRNPACLHVLWLLVLVKLVTPPVLTVPLPAAARPSAPMAEAAQQRPAPDTPAVEEPQGTPAVTVDPGPIDLSTTPVVSGDATAGRVTWTSIPWTAVLGWIWAGGIVLFASGNVFCILRFRRLLRFSQVPSSALLSKAQAVARQLGLRRAPAVRMLDAKVSPLVWSIGRPQIILPSALFERLEGAAQEAILAHELAHVRRGDHWVRLLELTITVVFWWHPLVWWASRKLTELEDQCCDGIAAELAPHAVGSYAAALVDTLDFLSERAVAAPVGAMAAASATSLARRITMLKNRSSSVRLTFGRLILVLALACLPMALAFGQKPPEPAGASSQQPQLQRRALNKRVSDFPEKLDLSTPESALAALARSAGRCDIQGAGALVWEKLFDQQHAKEFGQDIEYAFKHDPNAPKNLGQEFLAVEMLEVLTWRDHCAAVICKGSETVLGPGTGKTPYFAAVLAKINGTWKLLLYPGTVGANPGDIPLASSPQNMADSIAKRQDDIWRYFVKVRHEIRNGRTPTVTWPGGFPVSNAAQAKKLPPPPASAKAEPVLSAAEKKEIEHSKQKTWQLWFRLDMPDMDPPAVQFAILDDDPLPKFTAQVKRMQAFNRKQAGQAGNEARKEQLRSIQASVDWDFGFKAVSGDDLYLLLGQPSKGGSRSDNYMSNRPAGKKWLVTKTVHVAGKPVCWCVPFEVEIGKQVEVTLNRDNTFDLLAAFDKAMGDHVGTGDRSPHAANAPVVSTLAIGRARERVIGVRPQGNCSISGKVLSEATGKPVEGVQMYLHYDVTHGSIFVSTDRDGKFELKDIPPGPFSLCSSHTRGYQDAAYSPNGMPGPYPPFSLDDGEHRAGIVLKIKPACRISGKIMDENGKAPESKTWQVLAWIANGFGVGYHTEHAMVNHNDGTYVIDGLAKTPVYVMAINWRAAQAGDAWPPIYYPGTFSRSDAMQVAFDKSPNVDAVNITLRKEGGLTLAGTVRDEAGKPIPEAFVVIHRRDMQFDFNTAYTDAKGHYQIQGLGAGQFSVHVDAAHRGFVRTRTPLDIDEASAKTHLDFTLHRGVLISGKFLDERGKDWQIGTSYAYASQISEDRPARSQFELNEGDFSLTNFGNKHRPESVEKSAPGTFLEGEGDYDCEQAVFPTAGTFVIQGMMPGHTLIGLSPNKEKQKVVKILYGGRDILTSGIDTQAGQEIKGVTVVVGPDP